MLYVAASCESGEKASSCFDTDHAFQGAIAQLGERLNGIQEVGGSIPPGSTTSNPQGLGGLRDLDFSGI